MKQIGLILLQVIVGIIFVMHGIAKMNMGLGNVAGWFSSVGLPTFLAYLTAYAEIIGGLLLILGLGTRYVGIIFALLMIGAIVTVKLKFGLLGDETNPGYELELLLLAINLYFVLAKVEGVLDYILLKKIVKKEKTQQVM